MSLTGSNNLLYVHCPYYFISTIFYVNKWHTYVLEHSIYSNNLPFLFAAPPKPSLNVTFDCSVKPLQASLQWQVCKLCTFQCIARNILYVVE